jgi:hypothetical protein
LAAPSVDTRSCTVRSDRCRLIEPGSRSWFETPGVLQWWG